jgi:hypothetical protein
MNFTYKSHAKNMTFTYKGHVIAITQNLEDLESGIARIRIDDGITSDYHGTFNDAISSAKQWIDASSACG